VSSAVDVRTVIGWSVVPGVVVVVVLATVVKGQDKITAGDGKREGENAIPIKGETLQGEVIPPSPGKRVLSFSPPVPSAVLLLALFALFRVPEALLLLRLQDLGVPIALIPLAWAGLHVVRSLASYPGVAGSSTGSVPTSASASGH
jgi:hypothetical protein